MFVIDVMSRVPVYEQLINQVEEQILTGLLNSGDKMPSVRSLSVSLSINPNTIQKAYTELDRRKFKGKDAGIQAGYQGTGSCRNN